MNPMKNNLKRRQFLKTTGGTIAAIPLATLVGSKIAYSETMVDIDSPQAVALKYVEASAIDGQLCSNCALYQPVDGNDTGGNCPLFQGVLVGNDAWCNAWAAKG